MPTATIMSEVHIITENGKGAVAEQPAKEIPHKLQFRDLVWPNILVFTYTHIASVYALHQMWTGETKLSTFGYVYIFGAIAGLGVTAGAHRLWSHRTYNANLPARIILMVLNTIAFQNSVYDWARDHRVHHKFTDTNADPHNYSRGFFFAHMGWLMVRKHPDVFKKSATISLDDLHADGVVMFQKKYYWILMPTLSFFVPTVIIGYWLGGETLLNAWHMCGVLRWTISLHYSWSINSVAHSMGSKPYDSAIKPVDNKFVSILAHGEGFHNYHHVFPWDYKTSELGDYGFNITTALVDAFAAIGWAYDLKTVSQETIRKRAMRTGDQSWSTTSSVKADVHADAKGSDEMANIEEHVWGWDDTLLTADMKKGATIY